MSIRNNTAFVPNLTILYKDHLATRARLKALEALVERSSPERERAIWWMKLDAHTGSVLREMIEAEAKKDKQWAAKLKALLREDLECFAGQTAKLKKMSELADNGHGVPAELARDDGSAVRSNIAPGRSDTKLA